MGRTGGLDCRLHRARFVVASVHGEGDEASHLLFPAGAGVHACCVGECLQVSELDGGQFDAARGGDPIDVVRLGDTDDGGSALKTAGVTVKRDPPLGAPGRC